MGYLARRKARKAAQAEQEARLRASLRESYNHPVYGVDPATALLYTTIASSDVDHDEDVDDNADDTGREESVVDSGAYVEDSKTDATYYDPDNSDLGDIGHSDSQNYSYEAPEYQAPVTEVYQPSYDPSPSYDSGSSSYDSGSSSYDSGSSGGGFE